MQLLDRVSLVAALAGSVILGVAPAPARPTPCRWSSKAVPDLRGTDSAPCGPCGRRSRFLHPYHPDRRDRAHHPAGSGGVGRCNVGNTLSFRSTKARTVGYRERDPLRRGRRSIEAPRGSRFRIRHPSRRLCRHQPPRHRRRARVDRNPV